MSLCISEINEILVETPLAAFCAFLYTVYKKYGKRSRITGPLRYSSIKIKKMKMRRSAKCRAKFYGLYGFKYFTAVVIYSVIILAM